jgi:crotonobetainyl-CoA hydratase
VATLVKVERNGPVLEITLDRPPANAIDIAVGNALHAAFCELRDDPNLRVGIITGAGQRIFSAGWDMKALVAADDAVAANDAAVNMPGGFAGITEFWDLNKPVIAAVNGFAIGGGFEIALAADVILAADHAEFALPETQRGFLADAGAVQRLPRRIPYNVAVELMLTGRRMGAAEAVHWGLAHRAVPVADLMLAARELAYRIADGAPLAVQALLEVLPVIDRLGEREAFNRLKPGKSGIGSYERMLVSEDFAEGPRAFVEKRKPIWKGR